MISEAHISDDKLHRYSLSRTWGDGPRAVWLMLNPSTADAETDDPTIRKCIGFSERAGFGGLDVVNLFSLRATDPRELITALRRGERCNNDTSNTVLHDVTRGKTVIAAWGAHAGIEQVRDRVREVVHFCSTHTFLCLGTTKDRHPRHPVRVGYATPLVPWSYTP